MSIEENKAIVRRFYESFGKEDSVRQIREAENREAEAEKVVRAIFSETYAPDCIMHASGGDRSLEEDIKETASDFVAFPDLRFTVEDMIAEGDKVVTRWTAYGTNEGGILGFPATGKQVSIKGVIIKRLSGGKVIEEWSLIDVRGLMQQLGAIPTQ